MKWFRHLTCSFDDEKLSAVVDELGMEGYGFWWRILEVVAKKMDGNGEFSASFSAKKWGNFFGFSAKKFQNFVGIFQKNKIFDVEFSETCITVSIPNLLKYRDEWSRKKSKNSGVAPEEIRSKETETETDTETDTEKEELKTYCAEPFSGSTPKAGERAKSGPVSRLAKPEGDILVEPPEEPPVEYIPLPGEQGEYPVSRKLADELQRAYPGVDIRTELAKARAWCVTNPTKRKTARGVPRFLNAWMERTQNSGRNSPGGGGYVSPAQRRLEANLEAARDFVGGA